MKKKQYTWILLILAFIAVLVLILTKRLKITCFFAQNYSVRGVDVSHYQGEIDWERIQSQNVDFAFIKATEGSGLVDEYLYDNWHLAEQTGLLAGAYHFFSFDSDARTQAELFIDTVGTLDGKLPPVIDVEYYGDKWQNPPKKEEVVKQLGIMLQMLEKEYSVKPVIYTTYKIYYQYLEDDFSEYPLWIRNVYYPPVMKMGKRWTFWQYTDTALLEGYSGDENYIDVNVFRGTEEELEDMKVNL